MQQELNDYSGIVGSVRVKLLVQERSSLRTSHFTGTGAGTIIGEESLEETMSLPNI
ncbi:MAG: hypothetical protein RL015_3529 [Verrucomicrobiota bacterium]|jgi:hypothetical protein